MSTKYRVFSATHANAKILGVHESLTSFKLLFCARKAHIRNPITALANYLTINQPEPPLLKLVQDLLDS